MRDWAEGRRERERLERNTNNADASISDYSAGAFEQIGMNGMAAIGVQHTLLWSTGNNRKS